MKAAIGFLQFSFAQAAASSSAAAADFADHDDRFGLRIVVEHLEHVQVRRAVDRIAADADAGALAVAAGGQLPDGFIGQRAGAGDHADVALLVNVAGRDADAAAAVGVLPVARSDDARAVWPDEAGLGAAHGLLHFHHVVDRDAFGDADDQIQTGIDAFEDRVGGKWRRNENRRNGGARFLHGLIHGVEDRHIVSEDLTAFAGRDAGDDLVP